MFTITAGVLDRPSTVKIGTVERGSGFATVKERGESLAKRGVVGFPNGTKIWAVRIARDKDGKVLHDEKNEVPLAITDPIYKGEIKRLKWGTPGGSLIDVRYIKGYPSLDVLYQERILNFKVDDTKENSADVYLMQMENGDNVFDENIDPLLVEHLKGHAYNRDSESKDPNFYTYAFFPKSFDQVERLETKVLDAKFEAAKIVHAADTGGDTMAKCKNLFSIVRAVTDETPEDTKLLAYLKMIADKRPTDFLKAVDEYKLKVSNMFEKFKSFDAAILDVPGVIAVKVKGKQGDSKEQIIMQDVPGKGLEMFDYLLENFTDPKVFDATFELTKISEKLK